MECISLQACGGLLGLHNPAKLQCVRVGVGGKPRWSSPRPNNVRCMSVENPAVRNLQQQRVQVQRGPDRLVHEFRVSSATPLPLLRQVADALVEEMNAGLAREGGSEQLKMLPSYVENLPSGKEKGLFYAVDLGGTNFRVLRVRLGGKKGNVLTQEYKEVAIPLELMTSTGKALFDFIAITLAAFVDTEDALLEPSSDKAREAGFAFSFPVRQTSVKSGIVIHWTKGFKIDDAVGKDIVKQFQDAIGRSNHNVEIAALVNDTVGTLAGGRYNFEDETMIGCILGTGTNACYVERADAVQKWDEEVPTSGEMVINLEWGNFRTPWLPRTFADDEVDKESVNPGDQWFEKMISGMYLGEIVRHMLLKVAEDAALFGDSIPVKLRERLSLLTRHVSEIHSDESSNLDAVATILSQALEIPSTTLEQRRIVRDICDLVGQRGGRLAAAGVYGILKKIGRAGPGTNGFSIPRRKKKTVVAMDGGLFEHHHPYRKYMEEALQELVGSNGAYEVLLRLQNDGSGIGAALLAASHSRHAHTE